MAMPSFPDAFLLLLVFRWQELILPRVILLLFVIVVGAGLWGGEGGSEEGSRSWSACEKRETDRGVARRRRVWQRARAENASLAANLKRCGRRVPSVEVVVVRHGALRRRVAACAIVGPSCGQRQKRKRLEQPNFSSILLIDDREKSTRGTFRGLLTIFSYDLEMF
mgnify:CR=1 FL=1